MGRVGALLYLRESVGDGKNTKRTAPWPSRTSSLHRRNLCNCVSEQKISHDNSIQYLHTFVHCPVPTSQSIHANASSGLFDYNSKLNNLPLSHPKCWAELYDPRVPSASFLHIS